MKNILDTIGNTPLVKIKKLNPNPRVNIFAKLEGFNPTGSVKDRIALAMIEDAEKSGILNKSKTIIEPTSGNTGIGLAMVANVKGYKVKIVMPESMSIERRQVIKTFGAELILVKEEDWRDAAIKFTKDLLQKERNLVMLNQFENKANVRIHYETTGKEIWKQMNGKKIDVFIAGIGTGGTITGAGKRLKEKNKKIKIIGVQPKIGETIQGLKNLKEGYTPPVLDLKIIDKIIEVDEKTTFKITHRLAREEGLFVGPSSGAAMYAAIRTAKELSKGNIVVILPDRGEKYLSIAPELFYKFGDYKFMNLKFYNTLSRKKEILRPRKNKKVQMFVCGPTVYDFPHIGHARTYIVFDTVAKYLKRKGYNVFYLQNITDIDDKVIIRAKKEKISWEDLSKKFEKEYLKDMESLNVNSVTKYARATDHIKEIISQVKRLLEKKIAYQIKDGIYYNIKKFKDYGKLSRRTVFQAEDAVSRIDEAKEKRNKGDFCLWKFSKRGEPKWKSPFGPGRPGWHIEDTAISEKYFDTQYDVHGGARDLIFPHHEAEIAQMEAISEKMPMVKYWLHTGFLTVKGQKMSKSLGNFITIRDFLKKYSPRILRFFVLKFHYHSPVDYTQSGIYQAKKEIERIDEFIGKLKAQSVKRKTGTKSSKMIDDLVLNTKKEFEAAMNDDLNTPKALAAVFDLVNKGNSLIVQNKITPTDSKVILKALEEIDKVLDLELLRKEVPILVKSQKSKLKVLKPIIITKQKIPLEVEKLVILREKFREQKNWQKADEIRKKIKKIGWLVEDTKEGSKIKKLDR